jgi:hypothetical protein
MRSCHLALLLSLFAPLCHAQTASADSSLLTEARARYDDPFARNLKSFDCAVDFNWKQHWTETYRVGDEGTDAEIDKFIQPLRNRVRVTPDDAIVNSGMTEAQEEQLPRGGMAEGLLKHAVRFTLRTWLVAATNTLLPAPGTPVRFESSASNYQIDLKVKDFDVAMLLTREMSLQSMAVKGSEADRQEFHFEPGPHGFALGTWIMGEDGDFKPGNRLLFSYTYQTVNGFQIPSQVSIDRESHHEVWRYTLSDCQIVTNSTQR